MQAFEGAFDQAAQNFDRSLHFHEQAGLEELFPRGSLSPEISVPRLIRPDSLLAEREAGTLPLASIRTVHAATLFSGGAVQDGEVNPALRKDLERAAKQGVTALYVIGMWEPTAMSELWIRHWAPGWEGYDRLNPNWIGASTFATDDYRPNRLVGSWENLDLVLECARSNGLEIVPCFVTNTIGLGGHLMRRNLREAPETIMGRWGDPGELEWLRERMQAQEPQHTYALERRDGASPGNHRLSVYRVGERHDLFAYSYSGANHETNVSLLQMRDGGLSKHAWVIDRPDPQSEYTIYCISLGSEDPFDQGDGSANIWSDTVHRSVHLPETRERQIQELEPALQRFSTLRCDMAHLAGVPAWGHYAELSRAINPSLDALLLETYFDHGALLAQDPAISTYANFVFDWLHREHMNVPAVMWHVHNERGLYEKHRLVVYAESHDEKGTTNLVEKGAQALIITSLPVESVLWGQNQRTGDEFRIAAQMHIPREDFERRQLELLRQQREGADAETGTEHGKYFDYFAFFRKVEHLSSLPVFRSRDSDWKPVEFDGIEGGQEERIFHIARTYPVPGTDRIDRAFVLVDARHDSAGSEMRVDLERTYGLSREALDRLAVVNLLNGRVTPATRILSLSSGSDEPAPHSHAFALVPRAHLENMH